MKLINTNCEWDKEINISLSLRELQMIHDSIAITSYARCSEHWESQNKLKIPYLADDYYSLYDNLDNIIESIGGCANK